VAFEFKIDHSCTRRKLGKEKIFFPPQKGDGSYNGKRKEGDHSLIQKVFIWHLPNK
jgi:hypothetical protein